VLNLSSHPLSSLNLSSDTNLFGFDSDGLCTVSPSPASCPFGPTGYEGPDTSFSNINVSGSGGTVNFTGSLSPGATTCFSLEEALTAGQVFSGGPTPAEQGGAANPSERIATCFAADPVNCATGRLVERATDVAVPGRGRRPAAEPDLRRGSRIEDQPLQGLYAAVRRTELTGVKLRSAHETAVPPLSVEPLPL
jgi:hypothetical protein